MVQPVKNYLSSFLVALVASFVKYTQCIFLKGIYLTQEGYAKWYVAHHWSVRKVADNMQFFGNSLIRLEMHDLAI